MAASAINELDVVPVDPTADARPHAVVAALPTPGWKRALDVVAAGSALVLTSPIMLMVALVSRTVLGRPVVFRQPRAGLGAVPFDIRKFRTMSDARDEHGRLLPDEQRRTRWGNFLRRTSLDELPTLVNVLRGEMSLVGPRPLTVEYLDRYNAREAQRHRVRPGLTGLAQSTGRNTLGWSERFELDLEYVETRALRTDLRIIRDTVRVVLSGQGADGNDHCTEFMGTDPATIVDPVVGQPFSRSAADLPSSGARRLARAGTGRRFRSVVARSGEEAPREHV